MEFLIFSIRYIPFWCVPGFFIFMPFAYLFWLKDVKILTYIFSLLGFICSLFIAYWVYCGGPDKATQFFLEAVRSF